ncbi:BgTH12-01458 [Blumeria graminis f. sp. triticale]|uniref:BgTH12-01458 n=1 Tax=Blumeria graminis f. sp. triticale TaxID=1689686 RepID=A0A9W4GD43_BLUGR|nr:BgTH12-01458 [Blumeria graminis f. sp. triticale]
MTAATLAKAVQYELQDNVYSGISNFWNVLIEGEKPQWKDVRVVAKFTKKTDTSARKAKFTQLSSQVGENVVVTINGSNDDPTMQFKIDPELIVRPHITITRGTTCFETINKLPV